MASVTHLVVGVLLSGRSPRGGGGGGAGKGRGTQGRHRRDADTPACSASVQRTL